MALKIASGAELVDDELSEVQEKELIPLLEFYNFLCIAVDAGSLDLETIRQHRGVAMRDTFEHCKPYIDARRRRLNRQNLYAHYERFVGSQIRDRNL